MALSLLLPQAAVVERYAGEGAYGPSYDPPVTIPCRVQGGNELVRNAEGDEVVSSAMVFFKPDAPVTPESRIALDGTVRVAIQVDVVYGRCSPHHLEVRVQ